MFTFLGDKYDSWNTNVNTLSGMVNGQFSICYGTTLPEQQNPNNFISDLEDIANNSYVYVVVHEHDTRNTNRKKIFENINTLTVQDYTGEEDD